MSIDITIFNIDISTLSLSESLFPFSTWLFLPGQYKKEEPIFLNETSTVQWLGRGVSTAKGTSLAGEIRSHKPTRGPNQNKQKGSP